MGNELTPGKAIQAFEKWYRFYEEELKKAPTLSQIGHSALLVWLLSGNDVQQYPPPKFYSYPDHELVMGETHRDVEAWEANGTSFEKMLGIDKMVIDQCGFWKIVERHTDGIYIVEWEKSGDRYKLVPISHEEGAPNYRIKLHTQKDETENEENQREG